MNIKSPLTIVLILIAMLLLTLAFWSIRLSLRLEEGAMQTKGLVLGLYAIILIVFAWRARPNAQKVMLVGIVVVLIGGEIATRIINEPPEDPDFRQGIPYLMFAGQSDGQVELDGQTIELSDLGYRDAVTMPKPANEFRIFMLGGSTVFNGATREVSLAGGIENQLRANGYPTARVYNWGVYSQVSAQELTTILMRAVDYEPDMIVVYNGSNDLTLPYFFDPRPGYSFDYLANEGGRRIIEGNWGFYDLMAVLLRPTELGYTVFQNEIEEQITRRSQIEDDVVDENWQTEIVSQYIVNLEKMCVLASAFDFQLVAILQPMIFFKDTLSGQEPNLLGPQDYQDHTRNVYAMAQAAYRDLLDCTFIDASGMLQSDRAELFVDPVHLNDTGRSLAAQRLGNMIIEQALQ